MLDKTGCPSSWLLVGKVLVSYARSFLLQGFHFVPGFSYIHSHNFILLMVWQGIVYQSFLLKVGYVVHFFFYPLLILNKLPFLFKWSQPLSLNHTLIFSNDSIWFFQTLVLLIDPLSRMVIDEQLPWGSVLWHQRVKRTRRKTTWWKCQSHNTHTLLQYGDNLQY